LGFVQVISAGRCILPLRNTALTQVPSPSKRFFDPFFPRIPVKSTSARYLTTTREF